MQYIEGCDYEYTAVVGVEAFVIFGLAVAP